MNEGLVNWHLAVNAFGIGTFSALSLILGAVSPRASGSLRIAPSRH